MMFEGNFELVLLPSKPRRLVSVAKPRKVVVCLIYHLDENATAKKRQQTSRTTAGGISPVQSGWGPIGA